MIMPYLKSRMDLYWRRKLLKFAGLDVRNNYHLDSPVNIGRKDVERIKVHSPALNIERASLTEPDDDITYSYPRRYVYQISDAIIDPLNNLIYDSSGKLIAESSAWPTTRLLTEIPKPFIHPPKKSYMVNTYIIL